MDKIRKLKGGKSLAGRSRKLEEIAKGYKEQNKSIYKIENDIKTLHSAFLYGISSQQLVRGVKLLVD